MAGKKSQLIIEKFADLFMNFKEQIVELAAQKL